MSDFNLPAEIAKATPPIAVSGISLFGFQLPEVIQIMTLLYLSIQVIIATPKLIMTLRGKYGRRSSKRE